MASTYAFVVFAGCLFLNHAMSFDSPSLQPPKQTEWQKALFDRVQKKAFKLSEAAAPILLQRLDSKAFRAKLAACCPSVRNLTAQQLLKRLQDEVAVAEVTSGFSSVLDMNNMPANVPGMSVADGLAGSFFQNSWQAVLIHNNDSDKVFHRINYDSSAVSCNHANKTVSIKDCGSAGCKGHANDKQTIYPMDQCIRRAFIPWYDTYIFKYSCEGGTMHAEVWWSTQPIEGSHEYENVTCPKSDPFVTLNYTADGACHSQLMYNASGIWEMVDNAEMHSYDLKPFAAVGDPKNMSEASERGAYCVVNNLQVDAGSPLYGDVSAVFSQQAVRRTALLSAIDTGSYQNMCVKAACGPEAIDHNCSAYTPLQDLGTMDHFNHLFLIHADFWNGSTILATQFARLEGDWGSHALVSRNLLRYWEAVPAGTMHYPEDVKFLIGSFPVLFGTQVGAQLQKWAKKQKWVLIWSLGLNFAGQSSTMTRQFTALWTNQTFKVNQRFIDPEVAVETTAAASLAPFANSTLRTFQHYWLKAMALRSYDTGNVSNTTWTSHWHKLLEALPPRLHVRPLRSGDCPRPPSAPECVGMSNDKQCICYADNVSTVSLFVWNPTLS